MRKYPNRLNKPEEVSTLKDVIEEMLALYKLKGKLNETQLLTSWEKIMGKSIATRTLQLYIKNSKLFVKLNSAPLKNELTLSKNKVLSLLQEEIGVKVVEDVVFL